MAVAASAEGCHKEMSKVLDGIVMSIMPFMKDPVRSIFYIRLIHKVKVRSNEFHIFFHKIKICLSLS